MNESVWRLTKDEARAERGMVVAREPKAARLGADVLRRGGNAIDAAVTMAFALGVTEPMSSGIGGGGFMVVYHAATGSATVIDYAMDASLSATPDYFELEDGSSSRGFGWRQVKDDTNVIGPRSASIPGAVAGLAAALDRFGTIPLSKALEPAIEFAEQGFIVDPSL